MSWDAVQVMAGSVSSLIFMSGTLMMLVKTWRTKDVGSYSVLSVSLNNAGNLIYWVYVLSLPFGPIYLLHGFYTLASVLMQIWCYVYRQHPQAIRRITTTLRQITGTAETPRVETIKQTAHEVMEVPCVDV